MVKNPLRSQLSNGIQFDNIKCIYRELTAANKMYFLWAQNIKGHPESISCAKPEEIKEVYDAHDTTDYTEVAAQEEL